MNTSVFRPFLSHPRLRATPARSHVLRLRMSHPSHVPGLSPTPFNKSSAGCEEIVLSLSTCTNDFAAPAPATTRQTSSNSSRFLRLRSMHHAVPPWHYSPGKSVATPIHRPFSQPKVASTFVHLSNRRTHRRAIKPVILHTPTRVLLSIQRKPNALAASSRALERRPFPPLHANQVDDPKLQFLGSRLTLFSLESKFYGPNDVHHLEHPQQHVFDTVTRDFCAPTQHSGLSDLVQERIHVTQPPIPVTLANGAGGVGLCPSPARLVQIVPCRSLCSPSASSRAG